MAVDAGVYEWRDGALKSLTGVIIDYSGATLLRGGTVEIDVLNSTAFLQLYHHPVLDEWYFKWSLPFETEGVIRCQRHADVLFSLKFFLELGFQLDSSV